MKGKVENSEDLGSLRIRITRLTSERDNLEDERDSLVNQLKAKNVDLDIKTEGYNQLQGDFDDLKSKYSRLKERSIKLESDNANLEDRVYDKDRELERMRGELNLLERMVQNFNTNSNNNISSNLQVNRSHNLLNLQRESPNRQANSKSGYLRRPRFTPKSKAKRRNRDYSDDLDDLDDQESNRPETKPSSQVGNFLISEPRAKPESKVRPAISKKERARFYDFKLEESHQISKKQARNHNDSENNILTWDNPYNGTQHLTNPL